MDTCSVKVFLPGITATGTLEMASTLCGQAPWRVHGQDHATRHDVATPDMIRQLPSAFALVIRSNCAPVIARLPQAWRNRAYRRAAHRHEISAKPYAAFPPDTWIQPNIPDRVPAELVPRGSSFPWN
jgi:hypothetical protein